MLIDPLKWITSRFSDGTFGVWYGALDEETAIQESLYQSYIFAKDDLEEGNFPVPIERKMVSADIETDASVDLRKTSQSDQLVSDVYSFCQELGKRALKESIGMHLTPSSRKPDGTCTPVFKAECIKRDRTLYFLKFTFLSTSEVRITKDEDTFAHIPDNWK